MLQLYTSGAVKQYKRKIIWLNFWNGVPPFENSDAKQSNCRSFDSCIQNSSTAIQLYSGPEKKIPSFMAQEASVPCSKQPNNKLEPNKYSPRTYNPFFNP
jgi:hypothetical protein